MVMRGRKELGREIRVHWEKSCALNPFGFDSNYKFSRFSTELRLDQTKSSSQQCGVLKIGTG